LFFKVTPLVIQASIPPRRWPDLLQRRAVYSVHFRLHLIGYYAAPGNLAYALSVSARRVIRAAQEPAATTVPLSKPATAARLVK
jgi:hypothetical protein